MRPIPPSIKSQIIRKFLEGCSIPVISKELGVSVGFVSTLTTEESKKDEYFLYIHEIAKKFKSKKIEISDVITGIRLYHKIKETGLTIPFFENFLESTNTESFRIDMDHKKFLCIVKRILHFEKVFKRKMEEIPDFLHNAMKEYAKLTSKILKAKQELSQIYAKHSVKKSEIDEYRKEKFLFLKYKFEKDDSST